MIALSDAIMSSPETQHELPSPLFIPSDFSSTPSQFTDFQIIDCSKSPSAQLFYVQLAGKEQQWVIKMLCPYRDTRYSLETLAKRQQCLLEAVRRNRVFTANIFSGLAPLYYLNPTDRTIRIGEVLEHPAPGLLDANTEYVLLMVPQDRENRLDYLLERGNFNSLLPLVKYIANMHREKVFDVSPAERHTWGNYNYLSHKLAHNLELLDFLVDRCMESDWIDRHELAERARTVQKKAQEFASQDHFACYFQQRIDCSAIKLCHGDIKSPHVWLASDGSTGEQPWSFSILDAIDFNPMYNHIDILSDFAMLVADVEARIQLPPLVSKLIDCYLQETDQDTELARAVLDYYILDKAIVGTGISILYDNKPDLGRDFLKVAEHRLGIDACY